MRSVLFVCHGNIMRSPTAAAILRRLLVTSPATPQIRIASAGLHAGAEGAAPPPLAIVAAQRLGIALDGHRAQPLTPGLVREADLILVMDFLNEAEIRFRYPAAGAKTSLLGLFNSRDRAWEIPDPFGTDLDCTTKCFERIGGCVTELAEHLRMSSCGSPSASR